MEGAENRHASTSSARCANREIFSRAIGRLPPVKSGDLLVVWTAGAYGFAQSSNYNARRRPAEVLVEGRRFRLARRREKYDDLVRGESV